MRGKRNRARKPLTLPQADLVAGIRRREAVTAEARSGAPIGTVDVIGKATQ